MTAGTITRPADPRPVDLESVGYIEQEWFAAGDATAYEVIGELTEDGRWEVEPAGAAPYRTRFIVRRPADPQRFDGTVVMEWLNVSAVEAGPVWAYVGPALVDAGAAWVGVSAQAFGVVGGRPLIQVADEQHDAGVGGGIRTANPERYGTLAHPGDAHAFDIWTQIGAALRSPAGSEVLGGSRLRHLIAAGQSQSAAFLVAYVNGVQRAAGVFDGFFVHGRGSGAARFDGTPAIRSAESGYRIRDDLDVPVLQYLTETDVGPVLRFAAARQPDTDRIRTWEVAGTAHADAHLVGADFPLCPGRINDGPQQYTARAAMAALLAWVADGVEPPSAAPIETGGPEGTTVVRDDRGIARGGIRTPSVKVPISAQSGDPQPGVDGILCALFGSSTPFDEATLRALYGDRDGYLKRFDEALDDAIAAGFVRPEDRDDYAAEARAVPFPG